MGAWSGSPPWCRGGDRADVSAIYGGSITSSSSEALMLAAYLALA